MALKWLATAGPPANPWPEWVVTLDKAAYERGRREALSQGRNSGRLGGHAACALDIAEAERAGKAEGRRETLEEAAKIAETTVGGFTANFRTSNYEQEMIRDDNGPWVLNSSVAEAIRALGEKEGKK